MGQFHGARSTGANGEVGGETTQGQQPSAGPGLIAGMRVRMSPTVALALVLSFGEGAAEVGVVARLIPRNRCRAPPEIPWIEAGGQWAPGRQFVEGRQSSLVL